MSKKKLNYDSELMDFHEYDINIPSKTMFIRSIFEDLEYGESGVDALLTDRALKNITILDRTNTGTPINIVLNTPGGDWYHGMAIYDVIKECQSPVHIVARGQVMSMGSIIIQAADWRAMSKHATMMIHDGYAGGNMHTKNNIAWAQEDKYISKIMYKIYAEKMKDVDRSKLPDSVRERFLEFGWKLVGKGINWLEVKQLCTIDLILSAKDALALNLIDEVK